MEVEFGLINVSITRIMIEKKDMPWQIDFSDDEKGN
jgi:hypothetical protein